MKIRALGIVPALVLSLWGFSAASVAAEATHGDPAKGKAKAGICAACHGVDGNSTNPVWPKIAGQGGAYIERQVQAIKSGKGRANAGAATMRPLVATLSDEDIRNVAAYFSTQKTAVGKADPSLVAAGERLYRAGDSAAGVPACMSCHGPSGAGNPPEGFPRIGGQHAPYSEAQLKAFRADERTTDPNAMMRMIAKRLDDAQIRAVASYMSGLHENE